MSWRKCVGSGRRLKRFPSRSGADTTGGAPTFPVGFGEEAGVAFRAVEKTIASGNVDAPSRSEAGAPAAEAGNGIKKQKARGRGFILLPSTLPSGAGSIHPVGERLAKQEAF
jgi:hypothetical protein